MINKSSSEIYLKNISFCYGDISIFEAISINVPKNQIWALIGRSGVGKTTLLQIIAGLFSPSEGQIYIQGRRNRVAGRVKGVVFQDECLLGWLNVQQNILFPNHRSPSQQAETRASGLINEVGLAGSKSCFPLTLSTGMRKRVEFARALMIDDQYLLADEPFGTLDALTRRDLWCLWNRLRASEPRTGLLSTHDPEEAIRLCDAIVPLVSNNPAKIGRILHIPESIRSLAPEESSKELSELREEVVSLLV